MSGTKLMQEDLHEVTCYKCENTGHIAKFCSEKTKKTSAGNGKNKKQSAGASEKKKKKWQNSNSENQATKVVKGKMYKWCTNCNWGKGRWMDHDASNCPHRRKDVSTEDNNNDSDDAGLMVMVMDLAESGFLAINIV